LGAFLQYHSKRDRISFLARVRGCSTEHHCFLIPNLFFPCGWSSSMGTLCRCGFVPFCGSTFCPAPPTPFIFVWCHWGFPLGPSPHFSHPPRPPLSCYVDSIICYLFPFSPESGAKYYPVLSSVPLFFSLSAPLSLPLPPPSGVSFYSSVIDGQAYAGIRNCQPFKRALQRSIPL